MAVHEVSPRRGACGRRGTLLGLLGLVLGGASACGSSPGGLGGSAGLGAGDIGSTGAAGAPRAERFAALYDENSVVTFELTIPDACLEALAEWPGEYCEGSLAFRASETSESLSLERVGIRLKGTASFRGLEGKAAFKIKVDEFMEGQRFFGLRRVTLNNMVQDASMVHERFGYRLFRQAGGPAPLCNHARVYVNGAYYGLYANVQTVDDELFEHLYQPAPGNLYEALDYEADLVPGSEARFELETNRSTSDDSDLRALIAAVNAAGEAFHAEAGLLLDWDQWLVTAAVQALIADWDGYFGAHNNYKLYHELGSDRFLVIPWGIDQTFGSTNAHPDEPTFHLDYRIDGASSGRENGVVFRRCREVAACWEQYLDAVEGALALWESQDFSAELAAMRAQLASAISEDDRREYSDSEVEHSRAGLETFFAERGARVRAQLTEYGRSP